jgi:hypothetical protein
MTQKTEVTKEEIHFRGMFMSLFIDIEFLLGDSLATSLIGDNELKLNMIEFVNPKFMLEPKTMLMYNILKKRYQPLFEKYKNSLDELRKFNSLRNDFAHKRIEIDSSKKTLYFIVLDNGKFIKNSFTYSDLESKFISLKDILKKLNELQNDLTATQQVNTL